MIEELKKLKNTCAGCLDPNQNLIACGVYEHSSLMGVEELYKQLYAEYWEEANRIVDEEYEAANGGYYHPEWHRFEIGDNTRQEAMLAAYRNGWVRLIYNNHTNILYCESTKEILNSRKGYLKFIAECLDENCTLRLSEQK